MSKYIRKVVLFNPEDNQQMKLFEHSTKRPNFSQYVRNLIERDMVGISYISTPNNVEDEGEKLTPNIATNFL